MRNLERFQRRQALLRSAPGRRARYTPAIGTGRVTVGRSGLESRPNRSLFRWRLIGRKGVFLNRMDLPGSNASRAGSVLVRPHCPRFAWKSIICRHVAHVSMPRYMSVDNGYLFVPNLPGSAIWSDHSHPKQAFKPSRIRVLTNCDFAQFA